MVEVDAAADAPTSLEHHVGEIARALADGRSEPVELVIDVHRPTHSTRVPNPAAPHSQPGADASRGTRTPATPSAAMPSPDGPAVIVAVRAAIEDDEIEIHVRRGETRTIGRAPAGDGLSAAVASTLAALRAAGIELPVELMSVRIVETDADGTAVATVGLRTPSAVAHGIGTGPNPIEAAVRACFDAMGRASDPVIAGSVITGGVIADTYLPTGGSSSSTGSIIHLHQQLRENP